MLFLLSHVATCLHGNKEQIFAEIIANYDENSNNVRTFCTGGACDEEGEAGIYQKKRVGKEAEGGESPVPPAAPSLPVPFDLEVCPGDEYKEGSRDPEVCPGEGAEDDPGEAALCSGEKGYSLGDKLPNRNVDIPLRPHTVDIHKYQARHQRKYLFSKATDDALARVLLPTSVRKVRRAMKHCGLQISKDTITPEAADGRSPSAPKQDALRQNVRTMEDRHRMEARLEAWPSNKPKGAIYLIVTAARSNLLKGECLNLYVVIVTVS